jgi:phospholipid/cholesterol/gamma-HCH transport system permease protein
MSATLPEKGSPEGAIVEFFRGVGFRTGYLARFFGGTALLALNTISLAVRRPFQRREVLRQMFFVGVKSLTIVAITSIFVGMVLALQFGYGLARFGAKLYVAKLVALGLFREMGPVLTSLLVGGKVGSGMTAELGSMAVTEQIDAIRALGANPVKKLIVPRVIATTLMMPVLAVFADVIGLFGGLVICTGDLGISTRFYFQAIGDAVVIGDVMHGVAKCVFFGFAIGLIGCYQGIRTTGGTEGVGSSTTVSVVMISITILISDFFLTRIFFLL